MPEPARPTTPPGRPSESWTYMLSSQSRAGNCGHAGSVAKRLKIRSRRGCAPVCGKLPTSEGAAKKRGCSILTLLGSGENHAASTPCTISEIRTSCSEAQYSSKARVLRARWEGVFRGFEVLLEGICRDAARLDGGRGGAHAGRGNRAQHLHLQCGQRAVAAPTALSPARPVGADRRAPQE